MHLQAGARFSKHTDAYLTEGLGVSAAAVAAAPRRFPNRFVTVFVYLNPNPNPNPNPSANPNPNATFIRCSST